MVKFKKIVVDVREYDVYETPDGYTRDSLVKETTNSKLMPFGEFQQLESINPLRMMKIHALEETIQSINDEGRREKEFNQTCERYRAMRKRLEGKTHKEQLEIINNFRAGRE